MILYLKKEECSASWRFKRPSMGQRRAEAQGGKKRAHSSNIGRKKKAVAASLSSRFMGTNLRKEILVSQGDMSKHAGKKRNPGPEKIIQTRYRGCRTSIKIKGSGRYHGINEEEKGVWRVRNTRTLKGL